MTIVKNFDVKTSLPNQLSLTWNVPADMNSSNLEVIVTRSLTHFPMELYNTNFPTKATDSRPIEIFRGKTVTGLNPGTISVIDNVITDTGANLSTSPTLKGRLLRDAASQVFKITDNTATTITLSGNPDNGKYVILPDFPTEARTTDNFIFDIRTSAGPGYVKDLIVSLSGGLVAKTFEEGELVNLIFKDGAGTKFIISHNTSDTLFFFETTTTPVLGAGMSILNSFNNNTTPQPFIDNFNLESEVATKTGTGLAGDTFYYYTAFTKQENVNIALAQYGIIDSEVSTQNSAISISNRNMGEVLYNYWPSIYKELDTTEDLEYLMEVFGFQFAEIHSLIETYRLQDSDKVFVNALAPLAEQTGLPSIGFSIGADTLRRIARDILSAWKLKGSKEGIAMFIRILTTWDVTGGTGNYSLAIEDFLPNVEALRFFDENLGVTNNRITQTYPIVVEGGRFAQGLPGVVIPGFFTFREFVINVPNVALYLGTSEDFSVSENTTTVLDTTNTFGSVNSLVGNFLLPNQEEINDVFKITANTDISITVEGTITNRNVGGNYVVLSPLNTNRFIILNKLLPLYVPFGTRAGFNFT